MKRFVLFASILLLVIAVVFFFRNNDEQAAQNNTPPNAQNLTPLSSEPELTTESDPNVKTYTIEEVRNHGPETWDTGDSSLPCWMAIHGKVYEIPDSFTENHPGGHLIYEGCGTDATTLFETRPQGSGTPHSADARKILEKFYIGELKK